MSTPYERLTRYLAATGWIAPRNPGPVGGLWKHPGSELLLPVPDTLVEGGIDWRRLVERLAATEDAAVADVLARLDGRMVDIANLRAANDIVIADTIPFGAGVTLVREGWTMLRSSATTSLGPRPFISKYRPAGDALIKAARMAHSKRGSFIIPIHLPIPEPAEKEDDADEPKFDDMEVEPPESEQRRVMRTFAESLAAIDAVAVRPEREPNTDDVHDLIRAGVSHQFAAALHTVLEEDSVAEFSASFEWAPGGGPPPSVPPQVQVPSSARERIKTVSLRLTAPQQPRPREELTGPIIRVERHTDTDTGVVTVQAARGGRVAHVNVNVSSKRLDAALVWMRARETVVVESRVHRSSVGLMADTEDAVTPIRTRHLQS
ncbi:hypothetical protein [Mycolicibacterium hippocampi]|uniref:Uncharacterized protein n=1 Tax=Mycolicibacterium hippocampi TaxID=659824 RepID=A0A7I9ZGQ6_9MYCO|nr:hypothetical protein [Mycolicibacterium hippocampi]GFH00013.1 hypothetical protein MHIP_04960 [Mycolicibacterium hippocampi]